MASTKILNGTAVFNIDIHNKKCFSSTNVCVTLKIGVMILNIQLYQHRNTFQFTIEL